VAKYVASCDSCQRVKNLTNAPAGLLQPLPIPTKKWESVSLDLITGLPRTVDGHDAIVVFVDRFTKFARFIPTSTTATASDIAELFFEYIFRLFGLPSSLVSDRDSRWTGNFWRSLFQICGVKLNFSTAYHPQTDGQTERVNKIIADLLRQYCRNHQQEWSEHLAICEFYYNNAKSSSTDFSPAHLLFGQHPQSISAFISNNTELNNATNEASAVMIERMKKDFELATKNLQVAQQRAKQSVDKKRTELSFVEGELVYLSSKNIRLTGVAKLSPRFLGPFKVIKVVSAVNYKLELPAKWSIHPVFHVSRLRPCRQDPFNRPAENSRPPPIMKDDRGRDMWEVENIVGDGWRGRGRNKKHFFFIKWKNYPNDENTWEPSSYIRSLPALGGLVSAYEERACNSVHTQ